MEFERCYFVISSATQGGNMRYAANARRHAGFARNSKTDHRGSDATVFETECRLSRGIEWFVEGPVGNGERRERELSQRGERGPPAIFMEGAEAPKPSSSLVGAWERAQVDRPKERMRTSEMREEGERERDSSSKRREITWDVIHGESLVRNAHCCVSARAIVMGPRQPCPSTPSTVWPFALIQRSPAATRWNVVRSKRRRIGRQRYQSRGTMHIRRNTNIDWGTVNAIWRHVAQVRLTPRRNRRRNPSALVLRASTGRCVVSALGHGCMKKTTLHFGQVLRSLPRERARSPLSSSLPLSRISICIALGKMARAT